MAAPLPDKNILIAKLRTFKEGAEEYRRPRIQNWDDNYHLSRDMVFIDRIAQTQTINVPLVKETIKTISANIDDAPDIIFESRKNDRLKEMMLNEYWRYNMEQQKLSEKDMILKKQVILYGRAHIGLNILHGRPKLTMIDNYNLLIDRNVDPSDIDTAQYCCEERIYKQIAEIEADPDVERETIVRMRTDAAEFMGIKKNEENKHSTFEAKQRNQQMGDIDIDNPMLGEAYVELNQHFLKLWDNVEKCWDIWVFLTYNWEIVKKARLCDLLGVDFMPFESWGDDLELNQYWSDSPIDPVRPINKTVNVWISQFTENRTIRNFGMQYYNANNPAFIPQTYTPGPWKWFAIPGNPRDMVQQVEVPELSSVRDDINWMVQMGERATAASATAKGSVNPMRLTLGEIQLADQESKKRITSITKFYRSFYQRVGKKWAAMVLQNKDGLETERLYKKGVSGKFYPRNVSPEHFYDEEGYQVSVVSSSENEQKTIETLQKFQGAASLMPDNKPLKKALNKKIVGILDVTPEEEKAILDFEAQKDEMLAAAGTPDQGMVPGGMPVLPGQAPALPDGQIPMLPRQ